MKTFFKIIFFVLLIGGAYYGYTFYSDWSHISDTDIDELALTINQRSVEFLEYASNGDTEGAYSVFVKDFEVLMSKEEFERQFGLLFDQRELESATQEQYSYFEGNVKLPPGDTFEEMWIFESITVMTFTDGTGGNIKLAFIKEKGEWKIFSFEFRADDPAYLNQG